MIGHPTRHSSCSSFFSCSSFPSSSSSCSSSVGVLRIVFLSLTVVGHLFLSPVFCLSNDDLPRFVVQPESAVVRTGSEVNLWCSVEPNTTTIRWLLNGSVLATHRPRGVEVVRDGHLLIASFNEPKDAAAASAAAGGGGVHEGIYQCLATSPYGTIVSREARLESAVLRPSDSSQTVAEITVVKGNVAVVPCYPPVSRPQPSIEFELNGTRLILTERHMILPSGNLQISNVTQQDRGTYRCSAYNPLLNERLAASVVHKLTVLAPLMNVTPTFKWLSRDFATAVLGENLTLECAAEGWPVPELTWEKYGGHLPAGRYSMALGNLVIHRVQKFDAGTYLCRASNGIGQPQAKVISVEILESPVIEVSPMSQNVTEGATVHFVCGARGTPKVTTHWLYNANPMSTNNQFITVRDSTLILTNVGQHQSGMYQCVAQNGLGMTSSSARLLVNESPGSFGDEDDDDDFIDRSPPDRRLEDSDETGVGSDNTRHRGQLTMPSKPEVVRLSDTSVRVQWTIQPPSGGLTITGFKLQYKELVDDGPALWRTVGEEISPAQRQHDLGRLKPGSMYRFRVGAVFSNNDSKYSPSSNKVTMAATQPTSSQPKIPILPTPTIVELRSLSDTEIIIGWQLLDSDQWPIDGFYIFYSPQGSSTEYQKKVVKGTSVRHAVLSHLNPGTAYHIRMQSFSSVAGDSEFSSTFVKDTLSYFVDGSSLDETGGGKGGGGSSSVRTKIHPSDEDDGASWNVQVKKGDNRANPPGDVDWNREEDYAPGSAPVSSEGQLLYVALGVVFGLVALVTVVCIIICMVKQHRQQQRIVSAKERQKLQAAAAADPSSGAAFLGTMTLKPGPAETSDSPVPHVPGCNGGCSAAGLHGNDGGAHRDSLPLCSRTYDGKTCSSSNGKVLPELLLPPPPPLSNSSNCNGNCCSNGSDLSLSCHQNQSRCTGHIYSKLQDPDSSSKSSSAPSCDRPTMKVPSRNSSSHINALPQHLSPDHIPRSYEHHQPYMDQMRRPHNTGGRANPDTQRYPPPHGQPPSQSGCRGNSVGWRRDEMSIEEEENPMRDQATNTDLLSSNEMFSLYNDSDCNPYNSLGRVGNPDYHSLGRHGHQDGANLFPPGMASVVRDSFMSIDSQESDGAATFDPPGFSRGVDTYKGNGCHGSKGRCYGNKCSTGLQTGYPPRQDRDSRFNAPADVPEGRYNVSSGLTNVGPIGGSGGMPRTQNYQMYRPDNYR